MSLRKRPVDPIEYVSAAIGTLGCIASDQLANVTLDLPQGLWRKLAEVHHISIREAKKKTPPTLLLYDVKVTCSTMEEHPRRNPSDPNAPLRK